MAAARIAAVFLAAFLPVAGAQQSSQTRLTVQVTDVTGAFVSGARIAVDPPPVGSGSVLTADSQGQATLNLPAGTYTLSIIASGFKRWTQKIYMHGESEQTIGVILAIAEYGPTTVMPLFPDIPFGSPEPVFLPLQPLSDLAPLPSHIPNKPW
ncbi:MAG: carboxypeptidase-like regulatory domain-containing protein [Terracidiphilus sp.]|jgi:hypothetical protein